MRRGDVVRTAAEFFALPLGSEVQFIEGAVSRRTVLNSLETSSPMMLQSIEDQMPALVRVVGLVEPEWLEAAARAARKALPHAATFIESWERKSEVAKNHYRAMAKAAVAAADKARGIVNTREEFDALPAGTRVVDVVGNCYDSGSPYGPDEWPCVIVSERIYT